MYVLTLAKCDGAVLFNPRHSTCTARRGQTLCSGGLTTVLSLNDAACLQARSMSVFFAAADCLYKIAHSWLDPVVNPVQTALGCPLRTEELAYPINGA